MEDKNKKPQKPNIPLPPFFPGSQKNNPAPFGPSRTPVPPGGQKPGGQTPGRLPAIPGNIGKPQSFAGGGGQPAIPGNIGKPQSFAGGGGLPPPLPGLPGQPRPPAPFQGGKIGAPPDAPDSASSAEQELKDRLAETEKMLSQEKEKVLMASLKSQEEAVLSAKVETSLKEIQERLRRDKRDQELDEERSRLQGRTKELEARLVQERETWMQTLKSQMQKRETQDKDIETHFVFRLQEMERRWLDEKAHWQKEITAREEEIRRFKAVEKQLADAKDELRKTAFEKESMDRDISGLRQSLAQLEKQRAVDETALRGFSEKEKELIAMKAELSVSKVRRDNMLSEIERLRKDLASAAGAHQLEEEAALRKMQLSYEKTLQEKEFALAAAAQDKIRADLELMKFKAAGERLADAENGLKKAAFEKELADRELSGMRQALAGLEKQKAADDAALRSLSEKEKEIVSMKAELSALKNRQDRMLSEKESAMADAVRDKIRVVSEMAKLRGFVSKIQAVNAVLEKECQTLRSELKRIRPSAEGGGPGAKPPPPSFST